MPGCGGARVAGGDAGVGAVLEGGFPEGREVVGDIEGGVRGVGFPVGGEGWLHVGDVEEVV